MTIRFADTALLPTALVCAALLVLAPAARPDTIHTVSGERLQSVTVESESLAGVVYKPARGAAVTLPIEDVDRIEYERRPALLDKAAVAVADGDSATALAIYREYLSAQVDSSSDTRRFPWAAAYAARRAIELAHSQRDWDAVGAVTDILVANYPDSRHVPAAYLAKADALALKGDRAAAGATLRELSVLVESKGLAPYFALETRLGQAMVGSDLTPTARLTELEKISAEAGSKFPRLFVRSLVARGEALLQVGFDEPARRDEMITKARELFERAAATPGADARSQAGAKTGLAECLFLGADSESDKDAIERARDLYLRVAVLFPDEAQYAPRALFFAGRCFDLLGGENDRQRAQRLYGEVIRLYPGTPWAEEARNQRR